jgi:hypothetical protein
MSQVNLTCKTCENQFTTEYKFRDKKYCSRKCYFNDPELNNGRKKNLDCYEDRVCLQCDNVFNVRKKTQNKLCSDACRKEYNFKNKDSRIELSKKKCLEKYGTDSTFKIDKFRMAAKDAFVKKYNVDHPMFVNEIKNKMILTFDKKRLINFNTRSLVNNIVVVNIIEPMKTIVKCLNCQTEFLVTQLKNNRAPICRTCYPITINNTINDGFGFFLDENNISYQKNNRSVIKPKEIDFLINDYGFELNGNYWHSDYYGSKDSKYHLNKTINAHDNGVKLVHIFEDELVNKFDIVKSRVLNKLNKTKNKIYARKTIIKKLDSNTEKIFFNETHIQGYVKSLMCFGLYHNDVLVSAMSFSKNRLISKKSINDVDKFELLRFSNQLNTNVIGGFSKLLNYFKKSVGSGTIYTYSDIRWNGLNIENVYTKNGFNFIKKTPPNYWYVNTKNFIERHHRFSFRKDVLVKQGFDKNKTENEIMFDRGYDRIWDCGSFKYELTFVVTPETVSFDNIT